MLRLINIDGANWLFDFWFPAITDLHKTWVFKFVFVPLLAVFWIKQYKHRGAFVFGFLSLSLGAADFVGGVLKKIVLRPRPFIDLGDLIQRSPAGGFSFPSNHSSNMFCMAVFLSFFFPRHRWLFFVIALMIVYSRIYNGVHYPSDTLGGAFIGACFGFVGAKLCHLAITWYESRSTKENKAHV